MTIKIDQEKCCYKDGKCTKCTCKGQCKGCVEACPAGALTRKNTIEINQDACINCGACVDACKYGAIKLE
ncbi:MAG: 4Fe-4S binding protein [Candidatus Woesearchaeota archaeon]